MNNRKMKKVRIAVVIDDEGHYGAIGWDDDGGSGKPATDDELIKNIEGWAYVIGVPAGVTFINVEVPMPTREEMDAVLPDDDEDQLEEVAGE